MKWVLDCTKVLCINKRKKDKWTRPTWHHSPGTEILTKRSRFSLSLFNQKIDTRLLRNSKDNNIYYENHLNCLHLKEEHHFIESARLVLQGK